MGLHARSNVRNVSVNSTPEKIPRKRKWSMRRDLSILTRCAAGRITVSPSLVTCLSLPPFPRPTYVEGPFPLLSELCGRGRLFPRVSGNATARKTVSATSRTSVRIAGAAYTFSSVLMPSGVCSSATGWEAKYAPMGGPMQKHIAKAMPTCARAFARLAGVVMSERIALLWVLK